MVDQSRGPRAATATGVILSPVLKSLPRINRRSKGQRAMLAAAAFGAFGASGALSPTASLALTDTWQGGTATNPTWDQPTNWDQGAKPTSGDDAIFPTPIPTVPGAIISLGTAETANSLTLNAAYTLGTNAGGGDLTLTTGNITVASGITASIASQLKGTSGLTLGGGGTLNLTNTTTATTNNTFSGPITLNSGILNFTVDAELGAATNGVSLNGGTLRYSGGAQYTLPATRVLNIGAAGGTLDLSVAQKYRVGTAGTLTGSGTLTRAASANNTTGNNLSITVANTGFTGAVILNGGVTEVSANGLGNGATAGNTITVNTTAELAANNSTLPNALIINGGTIGGDNGTSTFSGSITANATSMSAWATSTTRRIRTSLSAAGLAEPALPPSSTPTAAR